MDPSGAARRAVYRALEREGFPAPARSRLPQAIERILMDVLPPNDLLVLNEREVTEPGGRLLEMFERRASRHTIGIPSDALSRAVAAARAEVGDGTVTYREVVALATWTRQLPKGRR
jgi:hypothetical protein